MRDSHNGSAPCRPRGGDGSIPSSRSDSAVGGPTIAEDEKEINDSRGCGSERVSPFLITRPILQRVGFEQCIAEINRNVKGATRRQRRQLARLLQKRAWEKRDRDAIQRMREAQ